MNAYVYRADLHCSECAAKIQARLDAHTVEDNGDSENYPQGPYPQGGGEADSPTRRLELALVQYTATGETRLVWLVPCDEIDADMPLGGVASHWLSEQDVECMTTTESALECDTPCCVSRSEMRAIEDLDGCRIVRRFQFA